MAPRAEAQQQGAGTGGRPRQVVAVHLSTFADYLIVLNRRGHSLVQGASTPEHAADVIFYSRKDDQLAELPRRLSYRRSIT